MDKGFKAVIKGESASPGMVEGRVCVVFKEKDFKKFRKRDVLVTRMTNPIFTPLMAMASAVVTDLGGSLSHAAIVSRELGIPCVVGTRNATKVLKNGDIVKVDGREGVVTKISER